MDGALYIPSRRMRKTLRWDVPGKTWTVTGVQESAPPPDAPAESFASPLLAPDVGVPAPGSVTVGYVEPRAWPDGTRFFLAVHDRDGNLL